MKRVLLLMGLVAVASASLAQDVPKPITDALARADSEIAKIIAIPTAERTFDNTLGALDGVSAQLDIDTSLLIFMQYVSTKADEREAARLADETVSNWAIDLSKREDLYLAIKSYADTNPKLEGEQKRLLEHTMRDYKRDGMTLPLATRERAKQIEVELNKLGMEFETNINEDQTVLALFPGELKGVPKGVLDQQTNSKGMILLGMDGPTYGPVMDYCENALTRQKVWTTYRRRG
ncbi:MAG: hypothetical protein ABL962_22085, partial [Fimbriimonadaceae bacterium]